MVQPKVYVDGILLNWADKLFFPPSKRARNTPGLSPALLYQALQSGSKTGHVRAQIDRTTRKAPEVMVKVTNKKGAGRGMEAIRNHLDYISRNGELEIEDHNRNVFNGRPELRQAQDFWQVSGRRRIPDQAEDGRGLDALNLMFSMAPGTPAQVVKDAVRDLLAEEFAGREYLFVLHTDRSHPHVHVCLKTEATRDLPRLRHGRKELQRWRESFAEQLRQHGIEANATPRPTRGQTRFPVPLHEHHRNKRQPSLKSRRPSPPPSSPVFQAQRNAWRAMAQALNQSSRPNDVHMARRIVEFWRATPIGASPASTPSRSTETKQYEPHEKRPQHVLAAARLGHSSLLEPHPGHPATRSQIKPVSSLRHVSGSDLVQNRRFTDLLLQPNARDNLEQRQSPSHPKL